MVGIIITSLSAEEPEPQKSLLAYLPAVTQLISGRRGLGLRFFTLTPNTLIIIYLIFWN